MDLNFLTITDASEDLQPLGGVLARFEREQEIQFSMRRVGWEPALSAVLKG